MKFIKGEMFPVWKSGIQTLLKVSRERNIELLHSKNAMFCDVECVKPHSTEVMRDQSVIRVTPSINQSKRWHKDDKWCVSLEMRKQTNKKRWMKTLDIKIGLAFLWDFWEDFAFKFSHLAFPIFLYGFEPRRYPLTLSVQTQVNKNS